MLNFPVPYPDELIYSLVARAGIHLGLTSPKQLLDEVFANRHVIATVDLPNHLAPLVQLLPESMGLDVAGLTYLHTLFPLYAPFTTEERRRHCLEQMAGDSQGAIHLILGVAASRIKQSRAMRYCPQCLQNQRSGHGEYYWQRQWQVMGADCCLVHGGLLEANIERHAYHRHQFVAASPLVCPLQPQPVADARAIRITRQVTTLLQRQPDISPSFSQWSAFYHQLANLVGCAKARHVNHQTIHELVMARWSADWLEQHGLALNNDSGNWLQAIFRKHRKSFSYLEHIVVLDSLLPESWDMDTVLGEVQSIPTGIYAFHPCPPDKKSALSAEYRVRWQQLLESHGVKQARLSHQALYAWLYRHDRSWLLQFNRQHHQGHARENRRVDWPKRDRKACRQLFHILNLHESKLDSPRLSRNWYLSKLPSGSMIEKNLRSMPLTRLFFQRYCEDITDYQIRRLALAARSLVQSECSLRRWRLLRLAGLSDERLTSLADDLLRDVLEA
ncbi:TPA: TniQ family protein [Citrobacter braakii]|uniref:TnsD family Tn7-like transposition protein n=1 Tax=Enterobacter cloacae complex TaxID=354276 RepID=UPI0018F559AD|nr:MULTISPECIES: TnsD family Tn7-like transposition protein [Enterobacter cloacae complex]HCB1812775.1 TniQ family protein [Citrobacter braakii]HCB1905762.1 TniQ family protein [Citrobacter braakii]